MNLRLALQALVLFVLGLPLLQMTLWWIEQLLTALGDKAAVGWLAAASLALRVVWLALLVCLVIALALDALAVRDDLVTEEQTE